MGRNNTRADHPASYDAVGARQIGQHHRGLGDSEALDSSTARRQSGASDGRGGDNGVGSEVDDGYVDGGVMGRAQAMGERLGVGGAGVGSHGMGWDGSGHWEGQEPFSKSALGEEYIFGGGGWGDGRGGRDGDVLADVDPSEWEESHGNTYPMMMASLERVALRVQNLQGRCARLNRGKPSSFI